MPHTKSMEETRIHQQTLWIVQRLFEEDPGCLETDGSPVCIMASAESADSRSLEVDCSLVVGSLEVDGGEPFNPVPIANKLREVADQFQKEKEFQTALHQFKEALPQQDIYATFSQTVRRCQVPESAEVKQEFQLIHIAVALGLYVMKKAPELRSMMEQATAQFLNTPEVGGFVAEQGGWNAVAEM